MNNTYKYKIVLEVEVEGFDAEEAFDRLQDSIGVGEELGVLVTECEYKPRRK